MGDERRQFERYPVKATVFARTIAEEEYQELLSGGAGEPVVPSVAGIASMAGGYKATAYDVSEGGIGIDGDLQLTGASRLDKGERLLLAIDIEGQTGRIKAMGRVVWASGQKGKYQAGVAFAVIAERDLETLREAIRLAGHG